MRNLLKASLLVTVMTWASATPASALTLTLNTLFSGANPAGDVTVTITDVSANLVQLVFNTSGLTGSGQFVSEWDLNLSPFVTPLTFNHIGGATATTSSGLDFEKADGDGFYDIEFLFDTANGSRLGDGATNSLTSTYTISGTGVDSTDFFALSQNSGSTGPFYSAAHVQNIGTCSGWIGAPGAGQTDSAPTETNCGVTTTTTGVVTTTTGVVTTTTGITPEPTMLLLLGSGLVMAGRRMRRSRTTL